ncbi:MAG: hypothetical protein IPJ37_05675 [Bacteroidales bacterium]|nr:hypothetical protein [Bacteroidales bacterium]
MDYTERYFELLEKNKELERELNALRSNDPAIREERKNNEGYGYVLHELLEMVNTYLAIFRIGPDKRFYIDDMNRKAGEIESILQNEAIGKCIDDTTLVSRPKLMELLHHIHITGEAHKLAASGNRR